MASIIKVIMKFFILFFLGLSIGYFIAYLLQFNLEFMNDHSPFFIVILIGAIAFLAVELEIRILEKYFRINTDFYFFKKQVNPFVIGLMNGFVLIIILDKL